MSTAPPLLEVEDLKVWFPVHGGLLRRRVGWVKAVDGVSFEIARGDTLGLVGDSGCGKTTTGRAIVRLTPVTAGMVRMNGKDVTGLRGTELRRRRRHFQLVFQDPYSSLNPRQTMGDIIAEPLAIHGLARGRAANARVNELLTRVGLDPRMRSRYPHEFSGGQRQRVGIPVHLNSPTPLPASDLVQIADWIDRYRVGRVVSYAAATWCSYREAADGTWYDDPRAAPAAPITRLGVYLLNDLARFLLPVRRVQVVESRLFTGRPTSYNAVVTLEHVDGTLGTVHASFCVDDGQPYLCSLDLHFERGTVSRNVGVVDGDDRGRVELAVSAVVDGRRIVDRAVVEQSDTGYQWEVFHRACRGDGASSLSGRTAWSSSSSRRGTSTRCRTSPRSTACGTGQRHGRGAMTCSLTRIARSSWRSRVARQSPARSRRRSGRSRSWSWLSVGDTDPSPHTVDLSPNPPSPDR